MEYFELLEFTPDFFVAFTTYSALLGVLLVLLGIILAGAAQKLREQNQERNGWPKENRPT
ncbi:MAG: hypothetical protein L0Y72_17585 [Gemmataceae bacterium]|nr:hypothetical protein [Gemmataceae bacterium]MCI0740864.1 hypothetical protein [Gemmataceae bacterium]